MDIQTFSSHSTIFSSLGVVAILYLCYFLAASRNIYEKEHWVGRKRDEWFSRLRAELRSYKGMYALADEGYGKFSKKDQVFILPELSCPPQFILPPSQMHNVLKQSESVLSRSYFHNESLQNKYTIRDARVYNFDIHMDVVRRQLTRGLKYLTIDIAEELSLAVDDLWGTDRENWKEVNLIETIMKIVSRAANRTFVGTELCRNETFTENCKNFSQAVFQTSSNIKLFPRFMRPVVGPWIARPTQKYLDACYKESKPLIDHRLKMNEKIREDPDFEWETPNDVLQWLIEETYTRNLPQERESRLINSRLCMVNMVAIHTTSLTSATTILDLYSTDPSQNYIETLREECKRVLEEEKQWSKAAIAKMIRVDSAIKESMRSSSLGLLSLPRQVASPDGFILDNDIRIPKGAHVAFSMRNIHHDGDFYPDPDQYQPLRFSAPREAYEKEEKADLLSSLSSSSSFSPQSNPTNPSNASTTSPSSTTRTPSQLQKILALKNMSMVSVADDFLSFGHGRHACPGRFFASNEVKMLMAYVIMNYDVEFMKERVVDSKKLGVSAPAVGTAIKVRRR